MSDSVEARVRHDTLELLNYSLAQQSSNDTNTSQHGSGTSQHNTSVSEESIKAAMPDVKIPLISVRLQDDRGNNLTPLKNLKASYYGTS